MKYIWTDKDGCGNLMIYIGDHMISLPVFKRCPLCKGSYHRDPYDDPCFVCQDERWMFFLKAWFWRVRFAWWDLRDNAVLFLYERGFLKYDDGDD